MAPTAVLKLSSAFGTPCALSALALALAIGVSAPAAAQQMYPGQDIRVNPAAEGGPQTLLYPDRKHVRLQPHLLQPGQTRPYAPIHLHMPHTAHHRTAAKHHETHHAVAVRSHEPAPREAAVSPKPAPHRAVAAAPPETGSPAQTRRATRKAPQSAPRHVATQSRTPAPTAIPFSFGGEGPATPVASASPPPAQHQAHRSAPAPAQKQASAPPPNPAPAPPKSRPATTLASAKPLPKSLPRATNISGNSKQAAILFQTGSTELSDTSNSKLKGLAFSLMTALANGAEEVELIAYGGSPGDKSSSARRISLKRALAVRESLIVYGVPANRIDVRALGGADSGSPDRVDIFVKG